MTNDIYQETPTDAQLETRRDSHRGWLQLILVIAFIGGAMLISFLLKQANEKPTPKQADNGPRALVVETVNASPQPYTVGFTTNGTVRLQGLISISPQVSGKVVWVSKNFYPGGTFKKNQPLFRIEAADFQNQISQLKAQISAQETALKLQQAEAQTAKEEWQLLYPDEKIPALVAKTPQLQERRAALQGARAQLKTATLNLRRATFALPFNGRVLDATLQTGQVVNVGQQYGQAYPADGLEIAVPLNKQQLAWVQQAATKEAIITVNGITVNGEPHAASIARLGGQADATTRFTTAYLKPKTHITGLLPGTFVQSTLPGPALESAWVLPVEALQQQTTVWAVVDGKLQKSEPTIVQTTTSQVIVEGLPGIDDIDTESGGVEQSATKIVTSPLPEATVGTPASIRSSTGGDE